MKFHKNKLLTTVSAIALVLAVGACSSSSDDDEMAVTPPPATDDEMAVTPPPATDDEMAVTPPPATDDEMAVTPPPATDDEMAVTPPPATDDEMAVTPPPATPDPVELAEAAYGEYLEALTAYEVARGVHALTPTAANLAALREAVNKVVTEATDALTSAGAGTAAQLVRAQDAVDATVTDSSDVAVIEAAVMDAADLVTALADAGTAATAYDGAKAAYEATEGMTPANLDALSKAATEAKATAYAALERAQGGSAAQLSEAQAAVVAADMADTHASGITMALEAGIADALTAYNTAKTEHATAKTAHDDDASLDNANALKTAADTLLAAAMDAEEKGALGATADQQTELESVSVTNAEAYVATAEDDLTTAQTADDAAVVVAQTAADTAAVVAATEAAKTKTVAITAEAGEILDDAGLGGSGATTDGGVATYAMTIKRPRSGTVIEITDADLMGEDEPEFTLYKDLGKGRTMHTRKMEADEDGNVVEEVVIVSTDIAAPKAVAFAKYESDANGMLTQVLDVNTDTTNDPEGGEATSEALAVDQANTNVFALVKSSAFTAGTAAELMFPDNDSGTTTVDDAFETAGTYNGAMGTYRCDGTDDCTVNINAMGAITGMSEGWIFTPDPRVTSDQPDYDHLHYGFWLEKTTDEDGVLKYDEVETFAGSSIPVTGTVDAVDGSAIYDGGSTGVYVKNVYTEGGSIESATSGHFTADVVLEATFGQVGVGDDATIAPNLLNTLTGTIDNFDLSGGEVNEWAVNLKGKIMPTDGTASGAATGGGTPGTFNATFHGLTPLTPSGDDADDATVAPGSVVGEFGANFSNGSVAGGFGARK